MDWSDIIGAVAGGATGGIFGLLGAILGAGAKYLQERQRQQWQRAVWAQEAELQRLQMQAKADENEQRIALAATEGSWAGLTASLEAEPPASAVHRWVNDARSLFRPLLTLALFVLTYAIWRDLLDAVAGEGAVLAAILDDAAIKSILGYIVTSVIFAATTAGVWWFGDRAMAPPSGKAR